MTRPFSSYVTCTIAFFDPADDWVLARPELTAADGPRVVEVSCARAARSLRRASRARFAAKSAASEVEGATLSLGAGSSDVTIVVTGGVTGSEFCTGAACASFVSLAALLRAYQSNGSDYFPGSKMARAVCLREKRSHVW